MSLAKIGHVAMPKFKGRGKVHFSHVPGNPKYLANSPNDYHRVTTNGYWMPNTVICAGGRLFLKRPRGNGEKIRIVGHKTAPHMF